MGFVNENGGFSNIYRRRVALTAMELLASAFNVPIARLTMSGRQRASVAMARQISMYLCHIVGRLSLREIASEFGREASTVSHACHVVEDRRDNSLFDKQVAILEEEFRDRIRSMIDESVQPNADDIRFGCPEQKAARVA
ncbi:MAG: helix-turn-helix domain-containing protein [Pseudomonadota bacterium]